MDSLLAVSKKISSSKLTFEINPKSITYCLLQMKTVQRVSEDTTLNMPSIAFKMATGTGKTVVMAIPILYHLINRGANIQRLVPKSLIPRLKQRNAKLVITNYHIFEPKILQGNKKAPLRVKIKVEAK